MANRPVRPSHTGSHRRSNHDDAAGGSAFSDFFSRVSWGAIFAGTVIALVVHAMLSLLGLGIGLISFSPTEADPLADFGRAQLIWMVVFWVIAMFTGGWVAGWLSGIRSNVDSMLHGVATWAVATLASFFLITTIAGTILGGMTTAVGHTLQAAGDGVTAVGQVAAEQAGIAIDRGDIDVDNVAEEIRQTLRDTDDAELQPEVVERRAEEAAGEIMQGAAAAAMNPQRAGDELQAGFDRALQVIEPSTDVADRDAVASALAERTDMSEAEARRTVIRWEQQIEEAGRRIEETADHVAERSAEIAEDVTDALGRMAMWSFFAMLLGLMSAGGGGFLGTRKPLTNDPDSGTRGNDSHSRADKTRTPADEARTRPNDPNTRADDPRTRMDDPSTRTDNPPTRADDPSPRTGDPRSPTGNPPNRGDA